MTTEQLITWILGSGGAAAAAFVVSFIIERLGWFQNLSSAGRVLISGAINVVLVIGAVALLGVIRPEPALTLDSFVVPLTGAIAYWASQIGHTIDKARTARKREQQLAGGKS